MPGAVEAAALKNTAWPGTGAFGDTTNDAVGAAPTLTVTVRVVDTARLAASLTVSVTG